MKKKIVEVDLEEFAGWVQESLVHIPYNDEADGINEGLETALEWLEELYDEQKSNIND